MTDLILAAFWFGLTAGLVGNILFNPALAAHYQRLDPPDQAMIMTLVAIGMLGSVVAVVILLV